MKDTYKTLNQKQYNLLRDIPEVVQTSYAKVLLRLAKQNQSIIDVGFGSGLCLLPLVKNNSHAILYGIDYSKTLFDDVAIQIKDKAKLFFQDVYEHKGLYDVIHFKAILHCFEKPEKALKRIMSLSKPGGYIVTGHEHSQIEDRIEQIFDVAVHDKDLEFIFEYYFTLRTNMQKPFLWRKFPAAQSFSAVEYICKHKKFSLVEKIISPKELSWQREYCLQDIFDVIIHSTYNVFNYGLSKKDKMIINQKMLDFISLHRFKMKEKRTIPASFILYIIKHNVQ